MRILETRCEGKGDRCGSYCMTLQGSLMRFNLNPCLPVEYEDDEQEPPCVRKLDSLIAAGE